MPPHFTHAMLFITGEYLSDLGLNDQSKLDLAHSVRLIVQKQ